MKLKKNELEVSEEQHDDGFPKKWSNKLPDPKEEAKSRIEAMSDDELKVKIIQWTGAISHAEKDLDNDAQVIALKEELKEKTEPYKEAIQHCQAQIRYASFILESRGK